MSPKLLRMRNGCAWRLRPTCPAKLTCTAATGMIQRCVAKWPCGLMDKALVSEAKDCRFESCQGHLLVSLARHWPAAAHVGAESFSLRPKALEVRPLLRECCCQCCCLRRVAGAVCCLCCCLGVLSLPAPGRADAHGQALAECGGSAWRRGTWVPL